MESLDMIFSQYKETCEVLIHYPTIRGDDLKDFVKKEIKNLLYENIDVQGRRLITEFLVEYISKLQSHCANMTLSKKVHLISFSGKLEIKEENKQ